MTNSLLSTVGSGDILLPSMSTLELLHSSYLCTSGQHADGDSHAWMSILQVAAADLQPTKTNCEDDVLDCLRTLQGGTDKLKLDALWVS